MTDQAFDNLADELAHRINVIQKIRERAIANLDHELADDCNERMYELQAALSAVYDLQRRKYLASVAISAREARQRAGLD